MRRIAKNPEPHAFTTWKRGTDPGWRPSYAALKNPLKNEVKAALLAEQGFVCCYCERRIAGGDSHIEHLVAQETDSLLDVDYENLLASCEPETKRSPPRCGHLKANRQLDVHPLRPDCSEHFVFETAGGVGPSSNPARTVSAARAISILGLDLPEPVAARKKAIEGAIEILASGDEATITSYRANVFARDAQGCFLPFATAVAQFFARFG